MCFVSSFIIPAFSTVNGILARGQTRIPFLQTRRFLTRFILTCSYLLLSVSDFFQSNRKLSRFFADFIHKIQCPILCLVENLLHKADTGILRRLCLYRLLFKVIWQIQIISVSDIPGKDLVTLDLTAIRN